MRGLLLLLAVACTFAQAQSVRAVATTGMVADVVENVGGSCVRVEAVMKPGVDPYLYKAKPSDVRRFYHADIIFYSGYHLEGKLAEVLEAFARRKPVVALAERAIDPDEVLELPGENAFDPHLWMDVSLWARTADVVVEELSELAPSCKAGLLERATAYKHQLNALDSWICSSIASIPERQRILVTAHELSITTAALTASKSPPSRASAPRRKPAWPISVRRFPSSPTGRFRPSLSRAA